MVKSIAVQLFLLGALALTFLFLKPSPVIAVCSYDANSYTSYTEQSNKCLQAGETCTVNGSKVTESGHGCLGCDGTYCLNEFWSQTLSCGGNADAKAYCGQATCAGQNQGCASASDCCSGLSCTNGVCAGSCTGNEPDAQTCTTNKGNWVTVGEKKDSCNRRQLQNGQRCIAMGGIGAWCNVDGCQDHNSNACDSSGGCGAAGCIYLQDSTIQNISCSYCSCLSSPPPPTGCTNSSWSLVSWIGYGQNGPTQVEINRGNNTYCATGSINWVNNASVNVPAVVPEGNVEVRAICTMADSPGLNGLSISNITNNIGIASNVADEAKFTHRIETFKEENPGEIITIRSSRATAGAYCGKTDDIKFCASSLPIAASEGYPNGRFVTDDPIQAGPEFDSKGTATSISGSVPLTWTHVVGIEADRILIVGVSYRGDKDGDANGDGKPDKNTDGSFKTYSNNANDGDNDDYVKEIKATHSNGTVYTLARVAGSHSQFIQGTDRGAKRHTVFWSTINPPSGTYRISVTWKNAFPDPKESVGGSISYVNVDTASPFAVSKGTNGLTSGCSAGTCALGEPDITLSSNISQTMLAIISAQTDANGKNPPLLQAGPKNRWRKTTANKNIMGSGVDQTNTSDTTTSVKIAWKYGYTASWAVSGLVIKGANSRVSNKLYWKNTDWGYVCGGMSKNNYVTITDSTGTPIPGGSSISVGYQKSLDLTGRINFSPPSDTTYDWYIETANLPGTTPGSGNRVKSPVWKFKVKAGPNLTASFPSAVSQSNGTGATTFRITNSGGSVMTGVTATFDPGTGAVVQNFNSGTWPKTIPVGGYVDQGTNFTLPSPGTYTARVTAIPATGITETNSADNVATQNYTVNPRTAYFQTKAGGITSLGTIKSTLPGPTNAISLKSIATAIDAGIISAKTSIAPGSGNYSENGGGTAPSGWNRVSATISAPRIGELSYDPLFTTVMTNIGINSTNITNECTNRGVLVPGTSITTFSPSSQFKIFCYSSILLSDSDLNTALSTIADNTFGIFVPTSSGIRTFGAPNGTINTPAKKRAIIFANGHLTINSNVTVSNTLGSEAGLVIVVNGNITANDAVGQLDGVYIFSGAFNSNSGATTANQLTGNGSLIGTGTSAFNLVRTYGTTGAVVNPAELWTYQPKYLWLFRNILTQPSYSWKELPPQ